MSNRYNGLQVVDWNKRKEGYGLDKIPFTLWKLASGIVGPWLTSIFKSSVETGFFPKRMESAQSNSYPPPGGGGHLGIFLGGYVPPGTPNWHPVLKEISPKIDTPF